MNYFKRVRIIIMFLAIWFGVPQLFVMWTLETGFYAIAIFTWIPGLAITAFLEDTTLLFEPNTKEDE
jgi:hypothetical protein